jgi:ABC-type amino acid transport substrate-binding protein
MACAGAIAGVFASLVLAASEPVSIATEAPFPAYTYLASDGTITGFERDVLDEVCLRAALDCSWTNTTFDQLIPGVMSGDYDIVLGGMAVTEERRSLVSFTQPYHQTDGQEWYIGRQGAPAPERAHTAVQSGTVHESHLRRLGLNFTSFRTEPEVLEALRRGTVDLALGPFETRTDIEAYLQANSFDFLYSDVIPDEGVAMAVCIGNTTLLDSLNAALDAMRADGTLQVIETRWFQ